MKVSIIGCGKMGESILKGLLNKGFNKSNIFITTKTETHLKNLLERYKVMGSTKNIDAINFSDVVILSIKPQNLEEISKELTGRFGGKILISILAGISIKNLKDYFKVKKVVRCMPNLPSRIGKGITVWTDSGLDEEEKNIVRKILSSIGEDIYVEKEEFIDIGTSLSGSGPAYVFLFLKSMTDAGVYLGLPRDISEKLSEETLIGSVLLKRELKKTYGELIDMVSSPGGTTVEALLKLEEGGFKSTLMKAIIAAYKKSKDLRR